MTRSRNGTAVRTVSRSRSQSRSGPVRVSTRCLARLTDPRLHTAVSESEDTSMISVHRLDRWTTGPPGSSVVWLQVRLLASLKVIQPLPVCASVRIIRP